MDTNTGPMPVVTKMVLLPDAVTMASAQLLSDRAHALYQRTNEYVESATTGTSVQGLYVCHRAVERHQDLDGARPGMVVQGLVLRSDGHRLHTARLEESGVPEGILLEAGDFYEIDPYDEHWTTVPKDGGKHQLIFYIDGCEPNGDPVETSASEMMCALTEDLVDAMIALKTSNGWKAG